jgi:hypothetical protein
MAAQFRDTQMEVVETILEVVIGVIFEMVLEVRGRQREETNELKGRR